MNPDREAVLRFRIRGLLVGFIIGLVVSGVTAFPLPIEVRLLTELMGYPAETAAAAHDGLVGFLLTVGDGLNRTSSRFRFYSMDTIGWRLGTWSSPWPSSVR